MKPADLSRLRLFDNVPLDSIEQSLDACAFQELATGEILIAAGQPNENVYLLLFGRLHVYLETPTGDPVATIEPGESVGELSVMDEQPTSALVMASQNSRLLVVPRAVFWRLIQSSHGVASNLLSILAERLRGTNTAILDGEERLRYLAQHDPLTDVPNRKVLMDRLTKAIASARAGDRIVAMLFLDLDRFKIINETLGHDAGDRVLQTISQRLRKCVRKTDTVARLGGDEFAIVLTNILEPHDISRIARGILEVFSHPIELKDREVFVTASMGISVYPYNGEDAAMLLQQAHIAVCEAKENGRNNYLFYTMSTETQQRNVDRLNLETDLRRALERGEFLLHYQPQVDLGSGRIVGVEALIRWQHPEHGLVPPLEFISLLEETGLIMPVGEWVLHTACQQAKAWSDDGIVLPYVSVNLSARQFDDSSLLASIDKLRTEMPIDLHFLELEITESMIMRRGDVPVDTLQALHAMGVRLTIDDFGTGYSSLAYLKRFPIQTLKIDRSFVKDLTVDADDAAIVSAVIALARGLGLQVVAEGVETAEQLDFLRDQHCYTVQGFVFSKPVPAEAMTTLLRDRKPLTPVPVVPSNGSEGVSRRVRQPRQSDGAA